jgi:hypothetical protein
MQFLEWKSAATPQAGNTIAQGREKELQTAPGWPTYLRENEYVPLGKSGRCKGEKRV